MITARRARRVAAVGLVAASLASPVVVASCTDDRPALLDDLDAPGDQSDAAGGKGGAAGKAGGKGQGAASGAAAGAGSSAIADGGPTGKPGAIPDAGVVFDAGQMAVPQQPFLTLVALLPGPRAHGVHIGDLTGDGRADVLTTGGPGGPLALYPALPDGKLGAPVVVGSEPVRWAALVDVDGDGLLDLALADDGNVSLRRGLPGGQGLAPPTPLVEPSLTKNVAPVRAGDFDGDGKRDLVFAVEQDSYSTLVVFLHGLGDGSFDEPRTVELPGSYVFDTRVANLDADPADEVVALRNDTQNHIVYVFDEPAPRAPVLANTLYGALPNGLGGGLLAGCVGAAKLPGIFLSEWSPGGGKRRVTVWPVEDTKKIGAPTALDTWPRPAQLACGDLDGDGVDDLIVQHDAWFAVGVFSGAAAATDESLAPFADVRPMAPDALVAADVDGDAKVDLVGATPYGIVVARQLP